jgi:NADPH:quinone reductase-like Zn-dependent oxidoreductase
MKAVYFNEHGGLDVLQYGDQPEPQIPAGWVLVRVRAAALNHVDVFVRRGWPGLKLSLPHILGCDGAGEIAALGDGVSDWRVGQRVVVDASICMQEDEFTRSGHDNLCKRWELLGETINGTFAEYVAVPAVNLLGIPAEFPYDKAAAAALVYLTAWHSLVTRGNVQRGETVLVIGASGGVNTAAIQIANYLGAQVYVVGSDTEKLKLAESQGADHLIDRSKDEDWSKAAYMLTDKRGLDVVVDNVGMTIPQSLRALRKGGRLLTVGATAGSKFELDNRYMFHKHLSILGSTMGTRRDFADVMTLVFAGKLEPVIDRIFPMSEARAAEERLESGEQMGKIVLKIDD